MNLTELSYFELTKLHQQVNYEWNSRRETLRAKNLIWLTGRSPKELKSLRRKYVKQQNNVKNNSEFDVLQFEVDIIDEVMKRFDKALTELAR